MGNDISCKIIGIGSIMVKMYDDTVRMLTYVRHVPELRKNLVSLGALYFGGYKFIVQGGVLKVSKGILVVMKDKKVRNLYQLEGRTESDQGTIISESASDSTCLWHQCLFHMSEKGLKVPVDRKLLPSLKSLNLNFCKHFVFGKQCRQNFKT
jgi:hypothetical protein